MSSGFSVDLQLSRVVERGEAMTLTCPVLDRAEAVQTGSAGTIEILIGSSVLLAETAVDTTGPPASYAIAEALTVDKALTDNWKEVWDLTGVGRFIVRGYLVRHLYHSRLTDKALEYYHPELLDLLAPGEATAEKPRTLAIQKVQRKLLAKGRRPWLIFDPDALVDIEANYALHFWANDASMRFRGNVDYGKKAQEYKAEAEALWNDVTFSYDESETGVVEAAEGREGTQTAGFVATAGNPLGRRRWR